MTKHSIAAALALATLATAGCATTESNDSTPKAARALPHELEATTGSNMRRRTPLATDGGDVTKVTRDDLERQGGTPSGSTGPSRTGTP